MRKLRGKETIEENKLKKGKGKDRKCCIKNQSDR